MSDPAQKLTMGDVIRARVADAHLRVFAHQLLGNSRERFIPPREITSRREMRDLLRMNGLSRAMAERAASAAWPAISPDEAAAETEGKFRAATEMIRKQRL